MLPALLITGYLGSGKTTLLINSVREHLSNRRVAIIVNELGEVGVDGKLLKNAYSEVLELPEGCICCSLHSEFEKALEEIKNKYNPEMLLVETSGGAVPFPVILSLQALECSVDGVICLVDCASFEKYKEDPTAKYQIGGSNIIVLNKTDLVNQETLNKIQTEVEEIWRLYRPVNSLTGEPFYTKLKVYKTTYGRLPKEVFEGLYTIPQLKNIPNEHDHRHKHRVINLLAEITYEELEERMKSLPKNVIRAKGIVRLKNFPIPVVINYTFGRLDPPVELYGYDGPSFLVLIEGGGCDEF